MQIASGAGRRAPQPAACHSGGGRSAHRPHDIPITSAWLDVAAGRSEKFFPAVVSIFQPHRFAPFRWTGDRFAHSWQPPLEAADSPLSRLIEPGEDRVSGVFTA